MKSITRLLLVALLCGAVAKAQPSPAGYREAGAVPWREAPQYRATLVPAKHRHAYHVAVTTASLERVLAELADDSTAVRTPGAWQPQPASPRDAFGMAGAYNLWMLARLYGGRPARVARGARTDRGQVIESWTLISPYPSADLSTLHPGTMRLILTVAPAFAVGFGAAGPLPSS